MASTKNCSTWRENPGKILDYFESQVQECPKIVQQNIAEEMVNTKMFLMERQSWKNYRSFIFRQLGTSMS
jgi:hypothetical protein